MEMKIGARLAKLRREKGLTQEQLAEKLGVSAPAVSKWETDSSYPDITLLCPLARALGTNVDVLLQFEAELPDEEAARLINEVMETALQGGRREAGARLLELLRTYPNSVSLKYQASIVCNAFAVFFSGSDEEEQKRWNALKKKLLEEVRREGSVEFGQTATVELASVAVAEGELERAEQLLKELPEETPDATLVRVQLCQKKKEPQKALEIVQKRLYVLLRQAQNCMVIMMGRQITEDNERALQICEVYKQMDRLFGLGGLYEGLFLDIYMRQERFEEAADSFARYVEAVASPVVMPKDFLFSPGLKTKESSMSREMLRLLLRGTQDEEFAPLLQYPQCRKAVEKLRKSIEQG